VALQAGAVGTRQQSRPSLWKRSRRIDVLFDTERTINGLSVNRRPTWTPGRTAVTRCGETIFKKKVGVTVGRRPITPKMTNYASASMI